MQFTAEHFLTIISCNGPKKMGYMNMVVQLIGKGWSSLVDVVFLFLWVVVGSAQCIPPFNLSESKIFSSCETNNYWTLSFPSKMGPQIYNAFPINHK